MNIIDYPEAQKADGPPTIVLGPHDRAGLAMVLRKDLIKKGQTGRKETKARFLERLERRRRKSRLVSPDTVARFMLQDVTRTSTLDKLAEAFEIEGGHEELIELARQEAFKMGLYKNPQHLRKQTPLKRDQMELFPEGTK